MIPATVMYRAHPGPRRMWLGMPRSVKGGYSHPYLSLKCSDIR